MDDKGLQNPKPQAPNPPSAATDDQVDKPVTSPPASPTPLPPPSIPSAPPVASGVTPPPTPPAIDDKPIPTEEVKMSKPKRRLGKNAKKIVGGVLVLALLVGGVVVGRNVVEERQVVESEALRPETETQCTNAGCTGVKGQYWKWVKIDGVWQCKKRKSQTECQDLEDENQGCGTLSGGACDGKYVGEECEKGNIDGTCIHSPGSHPDAVLSGEMPCTCQIEDQPLTASPTPMPTPTPFPTPTPSATPSPGPGLSCVGLSSDTDPIEYGDVVTFTCEGSFSSVTAPVAYFRYSVDSGTYTVLPSAYAVDLVSNTASTDITVDEYGEWNVQCRVCEDDTATASCTAWGEANGNGESIPDPGTLGGMCGGIAGILCEGELACDMPNQDPLDPQPDASGTCIEEQGR